MLQNRHLGIVQMDVKEASERAERGKSLAA
jgi:hypothetical protein